MENYIEIEKLKNALILCSNSFDDNVRITIAKQGLCLDKFVHDKNPFVRRAVVENGYRLDLFLYDEDMMVRKAIAKQGYGANILIYDKEYKVRKAVAKYCKLYNDQITILAKDPAPEVRVEIAKRGEKLTLLSKDPNELVRVEVAKHGYRLKYLLDDPSPLVRAAIASKGYCLEILLNDKSEIVRKNAKLYAYNHKNAKSEWVLERNNFRCLNCNFKLDRTKTPSKRCPKCNFVMCNFIEIASKKKKIKVN